MEHQSLLAALLVVPAVFPAAGMAQHQQDCSLNKLGMSLSATSQWNKTGDFQSEQEVAF